MRELLFLSAKESEEVVDEKSIIDITAKALVDDWHGESDSCAPYFLQTDQSYLRVTSGCLPGNDAYVVRMGVASHVRGGDPPVAILYSCSTGKLLAVMGYPFGSHRTSAVMANAARFLSSAECHRVAMIGTGKNAMNLMKYLALVRPIDFVSVYSRRREHREDFASALGKVLNAHVEAADDVLSAIDGAEIVYVSTNSQSPVLFGDWVSPGTYVASMGQAAELDQSVYEHASTVVFSSKQQEVQLVNPGEPYVPPQVDYAKALDLGAVISGEKVLPSQPNRITVFKESQGGVTDAAIATLVYERAVARGIGAQLAI